MGIEKIEILVAISELSAKQHCQSSPFPPVFDDQNQGRGAQGQIVTPGFSDLSPVLYGIV